MQPMPHGSPGSHAVIVFSERELTFTFVICYRPSVCRQSICRLCTVLSRLKFSAMFLRHLVTWPYVDIHEKFCGDYPGEHGGVKRKRGSQIERFWTYRTLYLGNGAK